MPKEFKYRGHTLEELQAMSMDEFIHLLPSRQRRSLLRGLTHEQRIFLENVRKVKEAMAQGQKTVVKTHVRDMVILPEMVSVTFLVHNGKEFTAVEIKPEMIGHYLANSLLQTSQLDTEHRALVRLVHQCMCL